MVPSILDRFTIHGPNGTHACYVTAPARASLSQLKDGSWFRLFQLDIAWSLAAQLVLAVDYVHAQGIVHGDLHLGNIIIKVPPTFNQITIEQLYEKYGAPELDAVVHLDGQPFPPGVPPHDIASIWLGEASEKITPAEARILLSEFGEAFSYPKELKYESRTPLGIRPPPRLGLNQIGLCCFHRTSGLSPVPYGLLSLSGHCSKDFSRPRTT
jgi:serine/threonine protein kinase